MPISWSSISAPSSLEKALQMIPELTATSLSTLLFKVIGFLSLETLALLFNEVTNTSDSNPENITGSQPRVFALSAKYIIGAIN